MQEPCEHWEMLWASKRESVRISGQPRLSQPPENMKPGSNFGSRSKMEDNAEPHSLGFVIGIRCSYKKM